MTEDQRDALFYEFPKDYPHGLKLSDREALEQLIRQLGGISKVLEMPEKIRQALVLIGTQTDCQCQGEPDCKWCRIRKILEK